MSATVTEIGVPTSAPGEEIDAIIAQMEPAFYNSTASSAMIACLVCATALMKPNCTQDEIKDSVKGMSEWLVVYLSSREASGGLN